MILLAATFAVAADAPGEKPAAVNPGPAGAAKAPARPRRAPEALLAPIADQPGLPRVLIIGDSISMGYTLPVRELLDGKANVHRVPANGGPTTNGLKNIDAWLGQGKWDVIHFNWGLHDIRKDSDSRQVSLEDYEKNLRELVKRLKATGAKLIWASTTPVPPGADKREPGDEVQYNAVAKKIMDENGIVIDDLYAFALPRAEKIQLPKNVHYTPQGSKVLAGQVAASISAQLPAK